MILGECIVFYWQLQCNPMKLHQDIHQKFPFTDVILTDGFYCSDVLRYFIQGQQADTIKTTSLLI